MADVVICYASDDRDRVALLAAALAAAGYEVWWDQELRGGAVFSNVIQEQLEAARAVLVAWSERAVASDWVKDEAAFAAARQKLIPLFLDDVSPPLGFGQYHGVDLSRWSGSTDDPAFERLIASVEQRSDGPALAQPPAQGRRIGTRAWLAAVSVMAIVGVGAFIWAIRERPAGDPTGPAGAVVRSVAVLPFENLSGDPDQTFFSDGISEEIIHLLTQVEGLKVSARTSAFLFRGPARDLREVGQALGVEALLEGSVRRSGEQLRITAQLIDAETGFHVWSKTYDRRLGDVLALQTEVAEQVLAALTGEERTLTAQPALAIDVYDQFLRARSLIYEDSQPALEEAAVLLDQLLAQAPEDARIHAARARTWILLSAEQYGNVPVDEALAAAAPHIEAAVRLAPLQADSHTVRGLGYLFERRFDDAVAALERAIELAPGDALPWHWLYFARKEAGGWGSGREALAHAAVLDPLYPPTFSHYFFVFGAVRTEEARALLARFEQRWPNHPAGLQARVNVPMQRGEIAASHVHQLAYCELMGYQRTLCGQFQVDTYFILDLTDGLNAVGALEIEPPLLDAFLCPVDSLRPITAFAEYRSTRFTNAWEGWRRAFEAGGADRGMDPTSGAVYAASEGRWEDVRALLEPLAGSPASVRANLVSLHPIHVRFYAADLALARKMSGDQAGADVLLTQLRALEQEIGEMHGRQLVSDQAVHLLTMSIAAVEGDRESAFAAYARAYEAGYRFRSPVNDPLLLQWRESESFRTLQQRYDADVAVERELVRAQLAGRSYIVGLAGSTD